MKQKIEKELPEKRKRKIQKSSEEPNKKRKIEKKIIPRKHSKKQIKKHNQKTLFYSLRKLKKNN